MSIETLTQVHVVISLIGLVSGFVVLGAMLRSRIAPGLATLFLATTIATSVTGFFFPFTRVGLGHVTGALSLAVLLPACVALYGLRLAGPWRRVYVSGATAALYLNVVVGVAQAFAKTDVLRPLAPTHSAPAFLVAQLVVLAIFIVLGALAAKRFHPCSPAPPANGQWQIHPSVR
ncbi:MAG: hypothetical protein ACHQK9_15410 [Reyranellales bacterium]